MSKVDVTFQQASKSLTGFDILAIEKQAKSKFTDIGGLDLSRLLIWIVARRTDESFSWNDALALTLDDMDNYFVPSEDDDSPKATS